MLKTCIYVFIGGRICKDHINPNNEKNYNLVCDRCWFRGDVHEQVCNFLKDEETIYPSQRCLYLITQGNSKGRFCNNKISYKDISINSPIVNLFCSTCCMKKTCYTQLTYHQDIINPIMLEIYLKYSNKDDFYLQFKIAGIMTLIVALSDSYLALKETYRKGKGKFFLLTSMLPLELQGRIANLLFKEKKIFVRPEFITIWSKRLLKDE